MARRLFTTALLTLLCLLAFVAVKGATGNDTKSAAANVPFEQDEQLIYEGEFSKLLLRGIKIAEFTFTAARAANAPTATGATQQANSQQPASAHAAPFVFKGDVESKGWFRKLFGINFRYKVESFVEPTSFNILRTNKLDEQGKRVRTSEAVFEPGSKVAWTERDPNDPQRPERVVTSPLNGQTHDIVSAIYYLRTQPLTPGTTFELALSDSGQVYRVPARVVAEKKTMKTVLGKVQVVRVDVDLFGESRPVEGKGEMAIWFTADQRHLPVKGRISTDMGTVDITLKRVTKATPGQKAVDGKQ